MRRLLVSMLLAGVSTLGVAPGVTALEMPDYLVNTPVGSWVTMENTTTRGKKVEVVRMTKSLVGEEMIDGKRHLWVEVKTEVFKVSKSGQRKQTGDATIVKMLSDASMFSGDAANVMANLQKLAIKLYIKTGDNVMDMSGGGAFASAMLKASGSNFEFQMSDLNQDRDFDTPLGQVSAHGYKGVGDFEIKVIIKKIKTHIESEMWLSKDIPFGLVEMISESVVNKKPESSHTVLIDGGMSGAKSEVDESTATENPMNMFKIGQD